MTDLAPVIHVVGPAVLVGSRRRQRCSWCGALLEDVDLATVAVEVRSDEATRPDGTVGLPEWPVGDLLAVDGGIRWVVAHADGDVLPPGSCALLDPEVTT